MGILPALPVAAMMRLLLGKQPQLFRLVGYGLVLAGVIIASRRRSAMSGR
jgi:drug/metabolite transporter (DMT)-like permease